ncbi:MAG: aspartate aminotransferase family protein [Dehalococcoidales bacterium]|nr:aspartate aminotransferase family protein [Dehalococcoidales bacterium]MDD4793667.1 aspartate aminotransferase family protein [Dehalococcoidales bacterium]MDD5122407.1 aspartate aminotransferase family protein [Dehalococcoidales bacterium]MDD5499077.1 aspartate aminotransferase family protein [Dehalococcoidales bacterium]
MNNNWFDEEHKYYMPTFKRLPVMLVRGKGNLVWDENGKEYLDFVAGWAVNALGHCHPVVVEATIQQASQLIHTSNSYYTIPQLKLARLLVENSCMDKVFCCNSGTEATEGAVKLARRYGHLHLNGAYEVITALGSFHGRTLAMVSASGQTRHQAPYTPLPSGFVNVEFNNIEALKAATTEKTCAVMLEPVQGEGGVNIVDKDYIHAVRKWCDEKGILLILDEIQTGIGRTGKLFAYKHFEIEPDIMTLAKGLGGGLPVGAIASKDRASVFAAGEHGSTFGGNPVTCAVAFSTLEYIIQNDIPEHAAKMGALFAEGLEKLVKRYEIASSHRGIGLLRALQFEKDVAEQIVLKCLENGLLINRLKPNAIRFMPSLIITPEEIEKGLGILEKSIKGL